MSCFTIERTSRNTLCDDGPRGVKIRMVNINADLTEKQTEALVQFKKCIGWNDYRRLAVSDEDAYAMRNVLSEGDYSPR